MNTIAKIKGKILKSMTLPTDFLVVMTDPAKKKILFFSEINKQRYIIKSALYGTENLFALPGIFKSDEKILKITLPKKDMPYIMAHEQYRKYLDKCNEEIEQRNQQIADEEKKIKPYELQRLNADMLFKQSMNEENGEIEYELQIKFSINTDDPFIQHILHDKDNDGVIPAWLEMLIIDMDSPIIQKAIGIL